MTSLPFRSDETAMHNRRTDRDERGVTTVIVALSLIALIGIAALAIDGGNAFFTRRTTQNAADTAALAGTEALNVCVTTGCTGNEGSIATAVQSFVGSNGADPGYHCSLVDASYYSTQAASDIVQDPCPANGTPIVSTADGVRVTAASTRGTTFGQAENIKSFKAGALAVAQLEKVVLTSGSAPFFACALSAQAGGTDPPLLFPTTTNDPTGYDYNVGQNSPITPTAVGATYNVWGPQVPTCGGGNGQNGFHGIVGVDTFQLPTWIPDQSGDRAGPTRNQLAGPNGCGTTLVNGCHVLLPMCVNRRAHGSGTELYCVRIGEFQLKNVVTNNGNGNSADAVFIGGSSLLSFGTGGGQPGPHDFRVIRLSL